MNKEFYKNPSAIAAFVLFVGFFIFPFIDIMGFSQTSFQIFKAFKGKGILLVLIPLASAYIIYAVYSGQTKFTVIAKWVMLILSAWFFLDIAFFAEKHSIKFVGFGLWLDLLVSILLMFDKKINDMICKPKPEEEAKS
jgi:hypothetical protein